MELELLESRKMTYTEKESIKNSIETLASTPYGTAPFIRNMGIRNYPPESESEIERNSYASEVITQAGIWENRAKVSEVCVTDKNEVKVVISNG